MNMIKQTACAAALLVLLSVSYPTLTLEAADKPSALPTPPIAKTIPNVTEIHGQKLVDKYFWLRDKKNPEVKAYLDAENAYTDSVMKPTESLQKKLYDELLSRIKETDVDVPYRYGDYFYYSRTEAGKQYPIRCRRKGSMEAAEETILDLNELAKGQSFMAVAAYQVRHSYAVDVGSAGRCFNVVVRRRAMADRDVLADRARIEERVLQHHPKRAADRVAIERAKLLAANLD